LREFYRRAAGRADVPALPEGGSFLQQAGQTPSAAVREAVGDFLQDIELLGRRTAEMHLALNSVPDLPDFRPEPLAAQDMRRLAGGLRRLAEEGLAALRPRAGELPEHARHSAERVLSDGPARLAALEAFAARP